MSTGVRNYKALIFLVIVLLLSNIGLLLYFLVFKKPGYKGGGQRREFSIVDFMKKEVGFNEEQTKQFKELHERNRDSLNILGENVRRAKNELYKLVQEGKVSDSLATATVEQISENQKKMELTLFRFYQKVRAFCDAGQKVKYDSLVNRMNNRPPWYRRGGPPRTGEQKSRK